MSGHESPSCARRHEFDESGFSTARSNPQKVLFAAQNARKPSPPPPPEGRFSPFMPCARATMSCLHVPSCASCMKQLNLASPAWPPTRLRRSQIRLLRLGPTEGDSCTFMRLRHRDSELPSVSFMPGGSLTTKRVPYHSCSQTEVNSPAFSTSEARP